VVPPVEPVDAEPVLPVEAPRVPEDAPLVEPAELAPEELPLLAAVEPAPLEAVDDL
jgi:hypothetical protein